MLIVSIHFTFTPEDADKIEPMFRELREATRKEEGVISFEAARGLDNPNVYALWEVYRDKAALDFHASTDYFKRIVIDGARAMAQQRNAVTVVPV